MISKNSCQNNKKIEKSVENILMNKKLILLKTKNKKITGMPKIDKSKIKKNLLSKTTQYLKDKIYYEDEKNVIYNYDCLKGLDKLIENGKQVELTITSPPYFNVKDYVVYENYQKYLKFLEDLFTKILTITKEGRICCVNISNILIERANRNSESKRIPSFISFCIFNGKNRMGIFRRYNMVKTRRGC